MKISRHLACAAFAFVALSVQAQYKCQVDGKTVFQQTPCAGGGGQKLDVKPASGAAPAASASPDRDWSKVIRSAPAVSSSSSGSSSCPSPQSIREMEYEASKIGNRDNASLQAELMRAKGCR